MDVGETLDVATRDEWRRWLAERHRGEARIWLVFYRKVSGRPSLPYDDAVEEAICFGWIDGLIKKIDAEKYARLFTPRRKKSRWSEHNKRSALKMLREGRMTAAGEAVLPPEVLDVREEEV